MWYEYLQFLVAMFFGWAGSHAYYWIRDYSKARRK